MKALVNKKAPNGAFALQALKPVLLIYRREDVLGLWAVLTGIKADCADAKHSGDNQNEDTHSSVFSLISIRLWGVQNHAAIGSCCHPCNRGSAPMANRSLEQTARVSKIIKDTIVTLLELSVKYDLYQYILEKRQRDWRELEVELHGEGYPIKGIGIIATRDQTDIHDEEPLSPSEVSGYPGQIPFGEAMASYAFTILEVCGDEVVALVNPSFVRQRKAWHYRIPGDPSALGDDVVAASRMFAEPFGMRNQVKYGMTTLNISILKQARNSFAHRGEQVNFGDFYDRILRVAVDMYFLTLPDEEELKIYPFEAYDDKWDKPIAT